MSTVFDALDLWCETDIDPGGREASGAELVGQDILHRLTTGVVPLVDSEEGFVEYGEDVRLWAGAELTEDELAARAATLGPIIERDECVREAEVTSELTTAPGSLWTFRLNVTATLRTGETITRIIGVSSVTAELLAEGR